MALTLGEKIFPSWEKRLTESREMRQSFVKTNNQRKNKFIVLFFY